LKGITLTRLEHERPRAILHHATASGARFIT
jgi:hypothetical protein